MSRGLRGALSTSVTIALLAGCGRSQPPIDVPGAMAQSHAVAQRAAHGKSWMLAEANYQSQIGGHIPALVESSPRVRQLSAAAKRNDLLYASTQFSSGSSELLTLSYPKGKVLDIIKGFPGYLGGLCSDDNGNVFVTDWYGTNQGYIYEYAHGGTSPIATLDDPGEPNGCSVDPRTGNLAVTNLVSADPHGNVAIYTHASGAPTTYDPQVLGPFYCSYDGAGNLFVDAYQGPGNVIAELPFGSASFSTITLSQSIGPNSLQYVGGFLVAAGGSGTKGPQPIYQISLSGSVGTVSDPIWLSIRSGKRPSAPVQFWVTGSTIIGPDHGRGYDGQLNFWRYPAGGDPKKSLKPGPTGLYGVTISRGP